MSHSSTKLLTANNAWGIVSNVLMGMSRFVVLLILARFYPVATMGQIALAWAVVTPLAYLILMEVRMVYVTDAECRIGSNQYLGFRVVASGAYLAVLAGTAAVFSFLRSELDPIFLLLCGGIRLGECWADMYLAVLQKREQMHWLALSFGVRSTGILAVLVTAVAMDQGVLWVLCGWLTVVWLVVILLDRRLAQAHESFAWGWRREDIVLLMRRAWPLGLYLAMVGVNANMGRYILAAVAGPTEVGFLWALMVVVPISVMAQAGINQSLLPRLAQQRQKNIQSFYRTVLKMSGLTSSVVLVVWLIAAGFGAEILGLAFGPAYAAYGHLLPWAVLLAGVSSIGAIIGDAVVAAQQYRNRAIMVGAGLLANALICVWMIPIWQVKGALVAALCGALMRALIGLIYLIKK